MLSKLCVAAFWKWHESYVVCDFSRDLLQGVHWVKKFGQHCSKWRHQLDTKRNSNSFWIHKIQIIWSIKFHIYYFLLHRTCNTRWSTMRDLNLNSFYWRNAWDKNKQFHALSWEYNKFLMFKINANKVLMNWSFLGYWTFKFTFYGRNSDIKQHNDAFAKYLELIASLP